MHMSSQGIYPEDTRVYTHLYFIDMHICVYINTKLFTALKCAQSLDLIDLDLLCIQRSLNSLDHRFNLLPKTLGHKDHPHKDLISETKS